MKKINVVIYFISIFIIFGLLIMCLFGGSSNTSSSSSSEKLVNLKKEIYTSIESKNMYQFEKLCSENDISMLVGEKEFAEKITKQAQKFYNVNDKGQFNRMLNILEKNNYENEYIKNELLKICFNKKGLKYKLSRTSYFQNLTYYNVGKISQEDINKYIKKHEKKISMEDNFPTGNSYYDKVKNRYDDTVHRDILPNGDIVSLSNEYFGDFAIKTHEREYLDSKYQIQTDTTHTLYFRNCLLADIDMIEDFQYAPPYLFSTYNEEIKIYKINRKNNIASLIYNSKLNE